MKAWQLGIASVIALAVMACEQKQAEPTAHDDANMPPTATEKPAPVTMDPYATDPYANEPAATPPRTGAGQKPAATQKPASGKESTVIGGSGRHQTHVVQKGDTLYGLARKYYNDPKRWKDIWEANRAVIPDKDKLVPGTKLAIP